MWALEYQGLLPAYLTFTGVKSYDLNGVICYCVLRVIQTDSIRTEAA